VISPKKPETAAAGSGPNGLSNAIVLASAGLGTSVFERNRQIGGVFCGDHTAEFPPGSRIVCLPYGCSESLLLFTSNWLDPFLRSHLRIGIRNFIGGDFLGGAMGLRQLRFRCIAHHFSTLLLRSMHSPGCGAHGMAGYHAATTALADRAR